MAINILYTDSDAVRAAVGVKDVEVPDSMLLNQDIERQLKTALYGWLPTYAALHTAGTDAGATDDEKYINDLLISYCLFWACVRVLEMSLSQRKSIGDGKTQIERFDVDRKELIAAYKARLDEAKHLLDDLVNTSAGSTSFFGKASPEYDPVTNT